MKERPIIFGTWAIPKLLDGSKTQTRRVITPQPELIYSVYGDIIQVVHNDLDREMNYGEPNTEANTNITERQLYGGERWENIFKDKIQRLREKGFSGLVFISRTYNRRQGIFSGFLVPQQYQGEQIGSSVDMYGISRDANQQLNAGETSRRQPSQQQARKPQMGNTIRELARQESQKPIKPELQQPQFKDISKRQGIYPLGGEQRNRQPKANSKSFRDEPTIHFRNLPWTLGDRLWVKETYSMDWWQAASMIVYKADLKQEDIERGKLYDPIMKEDTKLYWKSPIFMPRWASRITLEITEVRAERLQEITLKNLWAEGMDADMYAPTQFEILWDSLNAKRGYSFESDPRVWVISSRRM